jgi:hypothetical protein
MTRTISIAIAAALGICSTGLANAEPAPDPQAPATLAATSASGKKAGDNPLNVTGEVGTDASQGAQGTDTSRDQAPGTGYSGAQSGVQGTSSDTSAVSDTCSSGSQNNVRRNDRKGQLPSSSSGEVSAPSTHVGGTGRTVPP